MNFTDITNWVIPEGTVTQITDSLNRVIWQQPQPVSADYFYVQNLSGSDNTLTIKKSRNSAPALEIYTSTDKENWSSMGTTSTSGITATIPANGKLYLKCTAQGWGTSNSYNSIKCSGNYNIGGNIMSLLYGDNFVNQTSLNSQITFSSLFYQDTHLQSAEDLVLPATTLAEDCYNGMFWGCTSLTTAPALPATTLAEGCYELMFSGCTSLTTAPALPATTLAEGCYGGMFNYCSALTIAPALPATTLADSCYYVMFSGCTSLTTAPELPATTLANRCYQSMFSVCTSLNEVTTYADNISAFNCLDNWLGNVAATGDFYNLGSATYPSGTSGIPTGWTEHTSL